MTIYEAIRRAKEAKEAIEREIGQHVSEVAAHDLIALVTNRVVKDGKNYKGQPFRKYSTNPIPAWKLWGKSRTQKAERQVRELSRKRGVISYKKFREINNLPTNKKNFSFTTEMWRKFGVIKVKQSKGIVKVRIGGTTKASQDKIDENSEREGISIIEASTKERQLVANTTAAWLEETINKTINR